ncbi:MAG: hypothetical protein AAF074_17370 [Pseudomonadota bacterium]
MNISYPTQAEMARYQRRARELRAKEALGLVLATGRGIRTLFSTPEKRRRDVVRVV